MIWDVKEMNILEEDIQLWWFSNMSVNYMTFWSKLKSNSSPLNKGWSRPSWLTFRGWLMKGYTALSALLSFLPSPSLSLNTHIWNPEPQGKTLCWRCHVERLHKARERSLRGPHYLAPFAWATRQHQPSRVQKDKPPEVTVMLSGSTM